MYTYVQRPGCKKENMATYVYIRAGSRTLTRAYVRRGLVYMDGSERRNNVVVVFMGRQRNACSSGGNETRGSQPAGSERNAWSYPSGGLGRKRRWRRGLVYRRTEETDLLRSERGPIDREGPGVPQNGGNRSPTVETGVLLIGRGVAYRKTDKTDLCWSATVEMGVLFIGRGVRTAKQDSAGYCSSPPSTPSSLLELQFFHRRPPTTVHPRAPVHPASTACYSTGYC